MFIYTSANRNIIFLFLLQTITSCLSKQLYSSIFVEFDTSPVFLTLQSLLYPVKDNQVSGYFTDFVKKKKKWPRDNDRIIKLFKYLSFIRRRKKKMSENTDWNVTMGGFRGISRENNPRYERNSVYIEGNWWTLLGSREKKKFARYVDRGDCLRSRGTSCLDSFEAHAHVRERERGRERERVRERSGRYLHDV